MIMATQFGQQASSNRNPIQTYYLEPIDKIPSVTRAVLIILILMHLMSWFIPIENMIGNTPIFTVFYFELYRLLLSPFVGNSFINLTLLIVSFSSMGSCIERSMGSCAFLLLMVMLTLIINVTFTATCIVLGILGVSEAMYYRCCSFWLVLFGLTTMECTQVRLAKTYHISTLLHI